MTKKNSVKRKVVLGTVLCALTLGFYSCADTYDGDESWTSPYRNLESIATPPSDSIKVAISTDGSTMNLSWPTVMGVRGYKVTVSNVTNADAPEQVYEKEVERNFCSVPVDENRIYQITLQALGNKELGNPDSKDVTALTYVYGTPADVIIPDGTDIYEYLKAKLATDSVNGEMVVELVDSGKYTLSNALDFGHQRLQMRASKKAPATVTISGNGQLNTSAPLFLKNIHFVYEGESEANGFICLSKEPDAAIKGIVGDGTKDYYNIVCSADTAALTLYNCFIDGLNTRLLYDNDMKYCLEGLTILDTKIRTHYTADSKGKESPFIQFKKGGVKDTRFENSTVWNTGDANCQYFIQYENGARIDRFGYDKDSEHTTVSFISSTFWNIAAGNWCNYTGFQNFSIYTITRCIWVDSGGAGEIARRMLGNGRLGSACEATFLYNTYWTNGEAKDQSSYDQTETALTTDPAFVDAAAGNFTPTGADQLRFRTGDPRWLP